MTINEYDKKSEVVAKMEKVAQIVDICCSVRFPHICVCRGCNNAVRITENRKSGTNVFILAATLPKS
jgi:hypothetical protein